MLANGPIAWKSKKQPSVALSTTEAEYYALGIACQEGVWLKQLCQEIFMTFDKSIHIFFAQYWSGRVIRESSLPQQIETH